MSATVLGIAEFIFSGIVVPALAGFGAVCGVLGARVSRATGEFAIDMSKDVLDLLEWAMDQDPELARKIGQRAQQNLHKKNPDALARILGHYAAGKDGPS